MGRTEDLQAEMERDFELYAPILEWCLLLQAETEPDSPKIDTTAEFYRALDKIVRRDDFSLEVMCRIIAANWLGDVAEPECAEYYDEICWRALAVRQYLEARGEAKKPPTAQSDGTAIH